MKLNKIHNLIIEILNHIEENPDLITGFDSDPSEVFYNLKIEKYKLSIYTSNYISEITRNDEIIAQTESRIVMDKIIEIYRLLNYDFTRADKDINSLNQLLKEMKSCK